MSKIPTVSIDSSNSKSVNSHGEVQIPDYLNEKYWWAYLHPRSVRFFDNQWVINTILWGNFSRLRECALNELGTKIKGRTLQIACVYGDLTPKIAQRLSPEAHLDVVDVAPIQLENLRSKIASNTNISLHCQDASSLSFGDKSFEQVLLFFLLHEVPYDVRKKIVSEAFRGVKSGGKLVIIDYHKPYWFNPHRYVMWAIFKILEPFALSLWGNNISELIPADINPVSLDKTTFFGGLYQKVVIKV